MPLLWVCRNFRAAVYSRFFKYYGLRFDKGADKAIERPYGVPRCLEGLDGHFRITAKELTIFIDLLTVYSGKALVALSHEPFSGCSFPLVRTLEINIFNGPGDTDATAVLLDVEANISAFVQRIQQMAPKLNMDSRQQRLDCPGDYPFGDDLVLFRGNAATLEFLRLTLTRELAEAPLRYNVFTPTSHPMLQAVMLKPPLGMVQANYVDDSEIIQLMLDIAPGAAVRGISNWYLDQAPPPVLSLLNRHASIQVLALPALRLSLWDAMTLIQSLPLLSNLHAQAPTLDPLPVGVTKRTFVNYVCSNYSPMGTRFRCWHFGCVNVKHLKGVVKPFLLLALACPNFDYAAIAHYNRETFAKLLEKDIDTIAFKNHAPRLRRLLPYVLDKC
ncbi:hypothetical protein GGI13_001481 [Coemansia sp. RSA 455]|nr:hypothetical protein GGI13_001481 [Coemansia sp. RSA 455]